MERWLEIALWPFAACLFMAAIEYAVHRWPMHSVRFVRRTRLGRASLEGHASLHHGRYYRRSFAHDSDPASRIVSVRFSILGNVGAVALLAVPLGLWVSWTGASCLMGVTAAHALIWNAMHVEMHMPKGRWFSRTWYYRYVRDMHHGHHLLPGRNFAAVFPPFMDWLMGTYHPPVPAPTSSIPTSGIQP